MACISEEFVLGLNSLIRKKTLKIYFIKEDSDRGCVKIGKSIHPKKRLNQLQHSNPRRLKLSLIIYNARDGFEKRLHDYYSDYRVRGEWFEDEVLDDFLNKINNSDLGRVGSLDFEKIDI